MLALVLSLLSMWLNVIAIAFAIANANANAVALVCVSYCYGCHCQYCNCLCIQGALQGTPYQLLQYCNYIVIYSASAIGPAPEDIHGGGAICLAASAYTWGDSEGGAWWMAICMYICTCICMYLCMAHDMGILRGNIKGRLKKYLAYAQILLHDYLLRPIPTPRPCRERSSVLAPCVVYQARYWSSVQWRRSITRLQRRPCSI